MYYLVFYILQCLQQYCVLLVQSVFKQNDIVTDNPIQTVLS